LNRRSSFGNKIQSIHLTIALNYSNILFFITILGFTFIIKNHLAMKINFLILFALLSLFVSLNAQTLNLPLITINENETVYASVDEIHFTLTIESHAKEIVAARNESREISDSVFKYLKETGIPERYIQTKRMQISRNYIRNKYPKEYDGFNANQKIYVCLTDISAYDKVVDALLQMKVEKIDGPTFKSSKYEEFLKKARLGALAKARESASQMAVALGQNIGKAKLVKTAYVGVNNSSYSSNNVPIANSPSQQAGFAVGEIEIRASVEVSFELLD